MDFSSPSRALLSLERRRPELPDDILSISKPMFIAYTKATTTTNSSGSNDDDEETMAFCQEYLNGIHSLLGTPKQQQKNDDDEANKQDELPPTTATANATASSSSLLRWEALAVGLYCGTCLLEDQTAKMRMTTMEELLTGDEEGSSKKSSGGATTTATGVYMDCSRNVPTTTTMMTTGSHPAVANIPTTTTTTTTTSSNNNTTTTLATTTTTTTNNNKNNTSKSAAMLTTISLEQAIELATTLHLTSLKHLEHKEPRIRTLVAKAVGAHASLLVALLKQQEQEQQQQLSNNNKYHTELLQQQCRALHQRVANSIEEHMEDGQQIPEDKKDKRLGGGTTTTTEDDGDDDTNNNNYNANGGGGGAGRGGSNNDGEVVSISSTASSVAVLDDTTGWRALETNWQCLACFVQPLGEYYITLFPLVEEGNDLLSQCETSAIDHVNRHVRAAAMLVLEQWVRCCSATLMMKMKKNNNDDDDCLLLLHNALCKTLTAVLKEGLADNWSQVRMAASVLCRVFFLEYLNVIPIATNKNNKEEKAMYSVLIPRMCLNRFYLAQGVKLYSHDTWRQVFQQDGLERVAKNVGSVCRYYVKMADANNHVVREAACQAIAELAVKLSQYSPEKLQPYVTMLLQALLMCFHDESWPVRDEACLACGIFCKAYPEECRSELKTLWERWTEQLTDQIWSVREDAAAALGDAMQAYGKEMLDKCIALAKKLLPSAKDQPAMTMEEYKQKQNDIESHTDAQLYSCGSLAPKLGKKSGAGRIGCSNCGITRPKAPWEATDGCVYLLRELVIQGCGEENTGYPELTMTDEVLLPLLTELADVCRVQHFPQGDDLRATLWRQLPSMARAFGKQRFKRLYLDVFMDLLLSNMERTTASALSKHAAGQCAEELSQLIGPSIFRGRLDDYQQRTFDKAMRERQQQMPKGPMDGGAFSPFGPPGMLDSFMVNPPLGRSSPNSTMATGMSGFHH